MALKRLPDGVQSMLCASAQINTYKKAIEELVYNSLDAKSTSIAIRINIQDNSIQVVDNGHGITKSDLNVLGQRYLTSKITDLSTLKSAPEMYGYRGEFIANILHLAQQVKITSRHETGDDTWSKSFVDGKEKKFAKMSTRPSKGTTVDIKGFLYNVHIIKRGIESTNEMQNIKSFLEQLSLVHNNISVSLRDDSKNEIVFKIHKKRDIYHTLLALFDIDQSLTLELNVEKRLYKVKAIIGKTDKEPNKHWIFLNRRYINTSSRLHQIVNSKLKKKLLIKGQRDVKRKNNDNENFSRNIPFYFLFITCPLIDYDISSTPRQSMLEFKNWEQVNKLLKKLVGFYISQGHLKLTRKPKDQSIVQVPGAVKNKKCSQETREQVQKIMEKILGNSNKKVEVSQLQNGVIGKIIKRKNKKMPQPIEFRTKKPRTNLQIKECGINPTCEPITVLNLENNSQSVRNGTRHGVNKKNRENKKIKTLDSKSDLETKWLAENHKVNSINPARLPLDLESHSKTHKHKKSNPKHNIKCSQLTVSNEMDSVYKNGIHVAQKAETLLGYLLKEKYTKKNMYTNLNNQKNNLSQSKINKCAFEKYFKTKLDSNRFKTTYDLVKTIYLSQEKNANFEPIILDEGEIKNGNKKTYCDTGNNQSYPKPRSHYQSILTEQPESFSGSRHFYYKKRHAETYQSGSLLYSKLTLNDTLSKHSGAMIKEISNYPEVPMHYEWKNVYREITNHESKNMIDKGTSRNLQAIPECSALTYESHAYYRNKDFGASNSFQQNMKSRNVRFITKESKDNFNITKDKFRSKYIQRFNKKSYTLVNNKQNQYYNIQMQQTIDESYSIRFSNSNNFDQNTINGFHRFDLHEKLFAKDNLHDEEPTAVSCNTYTLPSLNLYTGNNTNAQYKMTLQSYTGSDQHFRTYSVNYTGPDYFYNQMNNTSVPKKIINNNNLLNVVFISKSQDSVSCIEPLNVCETILSDSEVEKELLNCNQTNCANDSVYNFGNNNNSEARQIATPEAHLEQFSHHFSNLNDDKQCTFVNAVSPPTNRLSQRSEENENNYQLAKDNLANITHNSKNDIDDNNFHFKNRLRFLPKGMSQIFENRQSKTICNYNPDEDYFENIIYDNFVNDVHVNTEIYEPIIQNVEEFTSKNIHKFENRLKSDNASLMFDQNALKDAKVLNQVDCKFIAAIISEKRQQLQDIIHYLVLFDQHAVSERIALENNLSDYLKEDKWKSVSLDNVTLKLSKDEILYLHNYKDKFTQLGLQWSIVNDNEVTVHSIPEAILGKNPREVDKVIKAVRNLIMEEINTLKLQKGCVSLYPKSIMDLVFSEACRYAIKFGDKLSKDKCEELLSALSFCKAPFQCAHGRPVMAVLMNIEEDKREYKVDVEKLIQFKQRNFQNRK